MNNSIIYENDLRILSKQIAETKPNKETGEIKQYCKLSLYDKKNNVLINVNCYDFGKYSILEENQVEHFIIKVTARNNNLDYFML